MDAIDKFLLGDIYGKLFLLELVSIKGRVTELIFQALGDVSRVKSLDDCEDVH